MIDAEQSREARLADKDASVATTSESIRARIGGRIAEDGGPPLIPLVTGALLAIGFGGDLTASLAGAGGISWRLGALVLIALGFLHRQSWQAFFSFAGIFAPWLTSCLVNALLFGGTPQATDYLLDIGRQLFMITLGAAVYARGARQSQSQRRALALTMLSAAVVTAVISLASALPFLEHGWSWQAVRDTKNDLIAKTGFGANSACFAGLVACLGAYRVGRRAQWLLIGLFVLLVLLSILLTARAPIAFLFLGAFIAWLIARTRMMRAPQPVPSFLFALVAIGAIVFALFFSVDAIAKSVLANELAGRGALWQIGMSAWQGHEIAGRGLRTFIEAIQTNLGAGDFTTRYEANSLYSLQGGGFHNIWISTLVERGIVGETGIILSMVLLCTRALLNCRGLPRQEKFLILLLPIFVFFRSFVEITGMMSYADSAVDAMVMVAIATRLSIGAGGPQTAAVRA